MTRSFGQLWGRGTAFVQHSRNLRFDTLVRLEILPTWFAMSILIRVACRHDRKRHCHLRSSLFVEFLDLLDLETASVAETLDLETTLHLHGRIFGSSETALIFGSLNHSAPPWSNLLDL